MSFSSLGLSDSLLQAVEALGYLEPTSVQTASIPAVLAGGDLWASARTGSGKTAAYVLPVLQRLSAGRSRGRQPRALVLVPTRELAAQVGKAVERSGAYLEAPLESCVIVGGGSLNPQRMALRGVVDVVVATPGRLLDLVEQGALSLGQVEIFVLDEADRLLSLGFAEELARIVALLPAKRQNLLFSATFPPAVQALAETSLHEPTRINVDGGTMPAADTIVQRAIEVDTDRRTSLLRHLVITHAWPHVLVFVASRHTADLVTGQLERTGIRVRALHGELSQRARTDALADFAAKEIQVLVATDLAARGIDVASLPAVVNYDLPRSTVDYVHRIGRTGRAGEHGEAISFVTAATDAHFRLIEKRHRLSLVREIVEGFEPTEVEVPQGDPHGGIKGKRKSKKDKLREAAAAAASATSPAPSTDEPPR